MSHHSLKRLFIAQKHKKLKQKYLVFLLHYQKNENYINIKLESRYYRKLSRYIYGSASKRYINKLSSYH
jgi:hypothetical protein